MSRTVPRSSPMRPRMYCAISIWSLALPDMIAGALYIRWRRVFPHRTLLRLQPRMAQEDGGRQVGHDRIRGDAHAMTHRSPHKLRVVGYGPYSMVISLSSSLLAFSRALLSGWSARFSPIHSGHDSPSPFLASRRCADPCVFGPYVAYSQHRLSICNH